MSRVLKYRLWDNEEKEYRKWQEYFDDAKNVVLRPDGQLYYALGDSYYDALLVEYELTEDGRYILEQYTGLTDKNGKEIYENDLIEEEINTGDDDIDGVYRYQVIWDEETLCWSLSPNYGAIHKDLWETNKSVEVIGNIHENPKLLDKNDNL